MSTLMPPTEEYSEFIDSWTDYSSLLMRPLILEKVRINWICYKTLLICVFLPLAIRQTITRELACFNLLTSKKSIVCLMVEDSTKDIFAIGDEIPTLVP